MQHNRNLWQQYLSPHTLLGLRFGQRTRYTALDIDKGSAYHPANDPIAYRELLVTLEAIGLVRPVVCTSSSSGGLHVYYFFEEQLPSFDLAKGIWLTLTNAGFQVRSGQIELFPNAKVYRKDAPSNYDAHRLPLQVGSYLLDPDLEPVGNHIGQFLDAADNSAAGQDLTELQQAVALAKKWKGDCRPGVSSRAEAWQQDLEQRIGEGWTGADQTNALIKDFACYGIVWRALDGEALIDYVVATALAAPGYQQWCSHQHEIRRRAAEWAQCCEGFYVPYCGHPNRLHPYKEQFGGTDNSENNIVGFRRSDPNAERHQQTFERIRSVVAHLEAAGTLPAAATARSAAIIDISKELYGIGVSQTTLHKHIYLPLWHPKHHSKLGVIAPPEVTSAVSSELKIEQIPDSWLEPKSLEAAPLRETEENYTLPSLMKVRASSAALDCASSISDAAISESSLNSSNSFQTKTHNNSKSELSSGAVNFEHKQTLSLVATTSVRIEPTKCMQIARLRLQAIAHAQKIVKWEALSAGQRICGSERAHREQIAKLRFYCQSGEPSLISEAREWALAHPGVLPESLQAADFSLGNPTVPPPDEATTPNLTEPAPHQSLTTDSETKDSQSAAAADTAGVELPTESLPTLPSLAKLQLQRNNRRLQPIEILTSAGEWVGGYFVHACIVVSNLVGREQHFTLFNAHGEMYGFVGQIRLPQTW